MDRVGNFIYFNPVEQAAAGLPLSFDNIDIAWAPLLFGDLVEESLRYSRSPDYCGGQAFPASGEMAPDTMTREDRREILHQMKYDFGMLASGRILEESLRSIEGIDVDHLHYK